MSYNYRKTSAKCVAISSFIMMLIFFAGAVGLYLGVYRDKFGEQYGKATCLITKHRVDVECDDDDCEYHSVVTVDYQNLSANVIVLKTNSQDRAEKILTETYPVNSNITCYYPKQHDLKLRLDEYISRRALIGLAFSIIF